MEKASKNPVRRELGLEEVDFDHEIYSSMLDELVATNQQYQSILMCATMYIKGSDSSEKAEGVVKGILGGDIPYFLPKYDEKEFSTRLWSHYSHNTSSVAWNYLYNQAIVCFVKYPSGGISKLLIAIAFRCSLEEILVNDPRRIIIEKLFNLFFEKNQDRLGDLAGTLFRELPNKPFEEGRCITRAIEMVISKLVDAGQDHLCIALVAFHDYLGKTWISDAIVTVLQSKGCDIESLYHELHEKEVWPWYEKQHFDEKWRVLVTPPKEERKKAHLGNFLEVSSLWSLIPLLFRAQKHGDVEIISRLLWHINRKERSQKLASRFQEFNGGYDISQAFFNLPLAQKGLWLNNQLIECRSMQKLKHKLSSKQIRDLKSLYAVRPFDTIVLSTMFRAELLNQDEELSVMYRYSVERIKSHVTLGTLLREAIRLGNEIAARVVAYRVCEIGNYNTLLFAVEYILDELGNISLQTRSVSLAMLGVMLELFEKVSFSKNPRYYSLLERYNKSRSRFQSVRLASIKPPTLTREEVRILKLFKAEQFPAIINLVTQEERSLIILETLLQTVLRGNSPRKVVEVYSWLAKVDRRIAASYNPEVDFHFRVVNMRARESRGGGMVSSVWNNPAMMEHPVNFQTKIVAENIFDFTDKD